MKWIKLSVLFLVVIAFGFQPKVKIQRIDLSGTWKYALDPNYKGIAEQWFTKHLSETLTLPGSLTSNGKGYEISLSTQWTGSIVDCSYYKKPEYAKYREPGNLKIPFWLQPIKYYKGAAWYQKEIVIPASWKDQNVELFLERCHWESRIWIDSKEIGMQNSLGTPHQYDLSNSLSPGKHLLTICIDNRTKDIDPGLNSHSISDHTQTNWNGIIGQIYLEARPVANIRNIQVYPDIKNNRIDVKVKVQNSSATPVSVKLELQVKGQSIPKIVDFETKAGENEITATLPMGDHVKLWSEFHPALYTLEAKLQNLPSKETDLRSTTFGMREFKAIGNQLTINGKPTFLRGTLECAIFPKTGFPPTEIGEWLRIFDICRSHGLNHMRFHSWCPPKAAFDAADQKGFYLQVECSSWANESSSVGNGIPFDTYLYEESKRMIDAYGNHPSFCMMAYGNEPAGKNQDKFLTQFVEYWKSKDTRRLYTSAAGWPNLPVNDYLSTADPRIQGWGQELKSIINGEAPRTDYDWSGYNSKYPQPVVSHEIGQWCVYPNFKEIAKYNGVVRARNFEIFQETLKEHGMEQLADSFLLASGKLQALCYKADIEAALRTKNFGGFQLLDLHDFPGQGTALVGVLDAFWGEKGYITPAAYKRFCNSTVPLARMKKCVFSNDETFHAEIEVAHYGDNVIQGCVPSWKIIDHSGKVVQTGNFLKTNIPLGNCFSFGNISFPLAHITVPEKLTLEVLVNGFSNSWDFWVYPSVNSPISGEDKIRVVQVLDSETLQFLKNGGSVLLTMKKGSLSTKMGGDIKIGFSSIFWNTAWTRGQAPHTLGILCNPKHPALAEFPTEYHSNWQWWDAMSHSGAINMTNFPNEMKPIVRVVDDWFTNRPLALIIEARVGKGKLLLSGIDLLSEKETRPEANQLFFSLKKYMLGTQFNPKTELSLDQVNSLFN